MKVVIDCNVLVSAARTGGVCGRAIVEAMRHHEVVLSEAIVDEYELVAGRPAHVRYRDVLYVDVLYVIVSALRRTALFVEPKDVAFGLRDPDDEVYLAAATAGDAALITGNRRDFTERRYGSVEVFSPRECLEQADR